jgi:hypothetical protein
MDKNKKKSQSSDLQGELFPLSPVCGKSVETSFTAPDLSSQGGLLLMREYERHSGFIAALEKCLTDSRCPYLIKHTYYEMLNQRIFQIAAGYEDADDCDLLRQDSIMKICAGRRPESEALSSQPTISRLENRMTGSELYRMGVCFVEQFIHSYEQEPDVIILDCDDSNFNACGSQQGTLFNNYHDEYCYMPLFIFEGISGKMILPLLRSGRRNKSTNIFGILRRLITRMRKYWKSTRFVIRGDSHFCSKEMMDWASGLPYVDFITGLGGNSVLSAKTRDWEEMAKKQYQRHKEPIRFFRTFPYKAGSWKAPQRVIVKIEVNEKGSNVRYAVTSFKHHNSAFLYQSLYCGRGEMELYIKELKTCPDADRTSCNKFSANQFRLFFHAAAYVLLLGIKREVFKNTELENASILSIREKILLTAVHIRELKGKIKIELPQKHPYRELIGKAFLQFARWRTTG